MYTLKRFLLHVTQVKLLSDNSCGLSSHECACKTAARRQSVEKCTPPVDRRRRPLPTPRPTAPTGTSQTSKVVHLLLHNRLVMVT